MSKDQDGRTVALAEPGGLDQLGSSPAASNPAVAEDPPRPVPSTLEEPSEVGPHWRTVPRLTNSPFPMLLVDRDSGAVIDANPAAVRAFGWSREELLTCLASDILPMLGPDEPGFVRGRVPRWMGPWNVRRKDGSTFFAEVGLVDGPGEGQPSMIMTVTPGGTDGEPQATRAWDETSSSPPLRRWRPGS